MNNTPITISQELIDQLIKDEVQRQLESKVTDALTQENIQRSIRTFVNKAIDMTIVDNGVFLVFARESHFIYTIVNILQLFFICRF